MKKDNLLKKIEKTSYTSQNFPKKVMLTLQFNLHYINIFENIFLTMFIKATIKTFTIFITIPLIVIGCNDRHERLNATKPEVNKVDTVKKELIEISKVTFFVENSGSMYGYVKNPSDYKNAIVSLSYFPEFDNTKKEFYFINGTTNPSKNSNITLNLIGSDPDLLKNNLNQSSFNNHGDPRYSDLTRMFEKVLSCAKESEITILVSDCIYDVGEESDPLTALTIETEKTKKVFRDRLTFENIQTVIIKAESQFEGNYFFSSKKGSQNLNQKRPYYILIFGDSKLLNKHFTEENISREINGYVSMARFMKIDNNKIHYQATNQNSKGTFRFDKMNKNHLINVEKDRNGQGFQFSIAVDYSSLPFPDDYFKAKENYSLSGTYKIVNIFTSIKKIPEVTIFKPSHLITIQTLSSPYGNIELSLKYIIPTWITETNSDNESRIIGDITHTFGFKSLIDAISEAYQYKNKQLNISTFDFKITK